MNRFGRNRPARPSPHKALARYLDVTTLPNPPASVDYTAAAGANLSNIFGNDHLGDCTAACYAHQLGIWTGNASPSLYVPSLDEVTQFYSACSGYQPGIAATDQGADELVVLDMAISRGMGGHKVQAAVEIDANTAFLTGPQNEVAMAIWLLGGVSICIELPIAWGSSVNNGFVWDVAGDPDPARGHCIGGFGYDYRGILIDSWGYLGILTWAAFAKYARPSAGGSCFAMVSQDWVSTTLQVAPNGFDLAALQADAKLIGGPVA